MKGEEHKKGNYLWERYCKQDPLEKKGSLCLGKSIPGTGNSKDKGSEQERMWCIRVRERKRGGRNMAREGTRHGDSRDSS